MSPHKEDYICGTGIALCVLLIVGLPAYEVWAQDHSDHADVHETTKDWRRPDGMSCCHDNDCRHSVAEHRDDGWWVVIGRDAEGRAMWRPAPPQSLMPNGTPPHDGRTIVCERYEQIYCLRPAETKI